MIIILFLISVIAMSGLVFARKITAPALSFLYLSDVLIFTLIYKFQNIEGILKVALYSVIVIIPYILLLLLYKNKGVYFKDGFISIQGLINKLYSPNKKDAKIIAEIIPFKVSQMKYNNKKIVLPDVHACGGVFITGAAGSGKTYGLMSMIRQDVKNDHPVVFIDYKGDPKMIVEMETLAKNQNIPFYIFSNDRCNFNYDPLKNLSESSRVEAMLNTRKWSVDGSDAHYRMGVQLFLQKYVSDFAKICKQEPENYTLSFYKYLASLKIASMDREESNAYSTILKMFGIMFTSGVKSSLKGEMQEDFSFERRDKYIVVFSFDSGSKEFANSISSFLFRDILESATKNPFKKELGLYVDETGSLENTMVIKDILEKGRSGGIMNCFAMQDVSQLIINSNEHYLMSLLGTINTMIIYAGATKMAASIMSAIQATEIDNMIVTLKKPTREKSPTIIYISKYANVDKRLSIDVYKGRPYIYDKSMTILKNNKESNKKSSKNIEEEPMPLPQQTFYSDNEYINELNKTIDYKCNYNENDFISNDERNMNNDYKNFL